MEGCGLSQMEQKFYETGILRYNSTNVISQARPQLTPWHFSIRRDDEPYDKQVPIVPWNIAAYPANNVMNNTYDAAQTANPVKEHGNVQRWELNWEPMW